MKTSFPKVVRVSVRLSEGGGKSGRMMGDLRTLRGMGVVGRPIFIHCWYWLEAPKRVPNKRGPKCQLLKSHNLAILIPVRFDTPFVRC